MTSSCCRDLKQLLDKYEVATKEVEHSDYNILAKTIIESTRQCKCLLRNPALILPLENLLKKFFVFCIQHINKMVGAKQIESTYLQEVQNVWEVCTEVEWLSIQLGKVFVSHGNCHSNFSNWLLSAKLCIETLYM